MTHEEVMQMMEEMKIPFAYDHFAEGESPDPPFICFLFPGSENFAADDVVYASPYDRGITNLYRGKV